jgi:hypothetical protein
VSQSERERERDKERERERERDTRMYRYRYGYRYTNTYKCVHTRTHKPLQNHSHPRSLSPQIEKPSHLVSTGMMYVCMHVCVNACMHACICEYMCMYVFMCMNVCVCVCVSIIQCNYQIETHLSKEREAKGRRHLSLSRARESAHSFSLSSL